MLQRILSFLAILALGLFALRVYALLLGGTTEVRVVQLDARSSDAARSR